MTEQPKFETWAIVEVMGHSRYAGFLSEQAIGGCSFVRVDVPEIPAADGDEGRPAFTKLLGQSSIFCITPCTEATARAAAQSFRCRAVTQFEMPVPRLTTVRRYDDDDDDECPV